MNEYLSRKIKVMSFFAIFLVVYIHISPITKMDEINWRVIDSLSAIKSFIEVFVRQGLTRIAVPLYFVISGYLFFRNIKPNGLKRQFADKYRTRLHSLLVPYVVWNVFWIVVMLGMSCAKVLWSIHLGNTQWSGLNTLLEPPAYQQYTSWKSLLLCFILPTPDYPLWFVRDLMILVLISPIIYGLIKRLRALPLVLLFVPFIIDCRLPIGLQGFTGNFVAATTFFSLGAYLGIHQQNLMLQKWDSMVCTLSLGALWIGLILLQTYFVFNPIAVVFIRIVHQFSILVGMAFVWMLYDMVMHRHQLHVLDRLLPYTFIIFVFHAPFMGIFVRNAVFLVIGHSASAMLIGYFIIPIITIACCILLGKLLNRITPRLYNLATGGR